MKSRVLLCLVVLTVAVLACSWGGSGRGGMSLDELQAGLDKLPAGDATRGEQIFLNQTCHTCHADTAVGPSIPGDPPLAVRGATRRADYSAELYLYESIIEPDAYIVPGFQKDIMPDDADGTLTDHDLADLIAYLMTMK